MNTDKTALLQELDAARADLWQLIDRLDAAHRMTPEWNKRDFFAHLAGWDALMFTVFSDHVAGVRDQRYAYSGIDESNRTFVAHRQSMSEADAKLESEINRFALRTLLNQIAAGDYGQMVQLPWGQETVAQFIEGAIRHEQEHAADIRKGG